MRAQLLTCLIGLFASLVPGLSFTGSFWEMSLTQVGDGPVHVHHVSPGSPAEAAGLRAGDAIVFPDGFDGLLRLMRELPPGGKQELAVTRGGTVIPMAITGASPRLAAVWYPTEWYPAAGLLFFVALLVVFVTSSVQPAPLWRGVVVCAIGLGLVVGFTISLVQESVFSRLRIWQQWLMGRGDEWHFGQGFLGVAACLAVLGLAAAEVRARLATRPR